MSPWTRCLVALASAGITRMWLKGEAWDAALMELWGNSRFIPETRLREPWFTIRRQLLVLPHERKDELAHVRLVHGVVVNEPPLTLYRTTLSDHGEQ